MRKVSKRTGKLKCEWVSERPKLGSTVHINIHLIFVVAIILGSSVRSVTEYTGLCNKQMRIAIGKQKKRYNGYRYKRARDRKSESEKANEREETEKKLRERISCIGILCAIYSFAFRNFHRKITQFFARRTGDLKFHSAIFWKSINLDKMIYFRIQGKQCTRLCTYIFLCFYRISPPTLVLCFFFFLSSSLLLFWFHLFILILALLVSHAALSKLVLFV